MHAQPTTITQKGQVTIPKEVRRILGLISGDQVTFVVTPKKEVHVKPIKRSSIMLLYGSLKPNRKPKLTGQRLLKWESEIAHEKWAKKDR